MKLLLKSQNERDTRCLWETSHSVSESWIQKVSFFCINNNHSPYEKQPIDSSEDDVKNLFEQYGTVESISIPRDRRTRQPRGFAFVDLSQPEECDLVVEKLNQQMFEGRILRVSKSAPRNDPVQQQKDTDDSRKKIYVGNIPFETTKEELMDFYRQFGDVHEVYVPVNAQTGLGRGFAFVTVEKGDMDKMIEATNGLEFGGRNIVVSVPLPPGEKAPERGSSSRVRLYVGNLSFYTTPDMLEECFSQYGTVYDVFIPEDPETGSSRGFAFVTMGIEDGKRAIDGANGSEVDGRTIRVNEAQPKRTGRQ